MKVLFFGELYPDVVHGVSISNRLCVDAIASAHSVDVIKEYTTVDSIGSLTISKAKNVLSLALKVLKASKRNNYDTIYSTLPISKFGLLKTIMIIYFCNAPHKTYSVLHLYRGDLISFRNTTVLNRLILLWAVKSIDRMIVMSQSQKDELGLIYPNLSIAVVPNSVFDEASFISKNTECNPGGQFLYVSNYLKEKGIFDLIESFKARPDISISCYGAFRNNEKDIRAKLPANVSINGPILSKEKFRLLASSRALILPSWNEGAPIIILESMMTGTPILTTRVGLIVELLGDDYPFYFDSQSPKDLLRCISHFMECKNIAEVKKKLKARYTMHFSNQSNKLAILNAIDSSQSMQSK